MVNVPPLLCSTPPPIDFGEDDEDVDDLPQSLNGVGNDQFVDFLSEDDTNNIEPLPSPRPPSVCDLPSVSIYDDYVPPEEEDLTNHTTSPSKTINDNRSKDSKNNSKPVTEAYNFNVRNNEDTKTIMRNEQICSSMKAKPKKTLHKPIEEEVTPNEGVAGSQTVLCSIGEQVKDIKIESSNIESSDQANMNFIHDVVSIEDVDDISDNELYLSKNFIETDNLNDYFKIEEIKTENSADSENRLDSKDSCSKSSSVSDNNDFASLERKNQNNFQSLSCNHFLKNTFDTPPPLPNDVHSISDDDDFGDFADFQEIHFVNNTVPVNDISSNQNNNNLELPEVIANESVCLREVKDSENFEAKQEKISKQVSRENSEDVDYDKLAVSKLEQSVEIVSQTDDDFVALDVPSEINENDDFGNFTEFADSVENMEIQTITSNDVCNENEEYVEFADFKTQINVTKLKEMGSTYCEFSKNDRTMDSDDDDDFGDFNTAQPITPTASNLTFNKASQNKFNETSALPSKKVTESISKILQLMFCPLNCPENGNDLPKADKIQDIPFTSIDTAKALEYQWIVSETRHSFIRSLGIDSKNILFGDNWNPSLPRFAANLSFNPLKPMKPTYPSNNAAEGFSSVSEPISSNCSGTTQVLEMSDNSKLDLNWNLSNGRSIEASKDDNVNQVLPSTTITSIPCISNDASIIEPVSSIDNRLVCEDKLSKTPPISEMESVTTFSPSLPAATLETEVPTELVSKTINDLSLKEVAESINNTLNVNEVVVTSTFSGTFKETHIYTPPKTNEHAFGSSSASSSSPLKASPIDFDYEKAAMGVIINETVVKKEYRDVEYNPPFTMESLSKSATSKTDIFEINNYANTNTNIISSSDIKVAIDHEAEVDSNDDFSEFQSVSIDVPNSAKIENSLEVPKAASVSHGGMILSPAILIPQAISMENQKPKIEWGDSTATINPEELARIEELFPEPKSVKSSNSSQKSTPTHQVSSTPSISATVANKELEGNTYNYNDDDDWSDFVSVPVINNASANKTVINNNFMAKSPNDSPFQQRSPVVSHRMPPTTYNNSNYDEEWSEFVSSAPTPQQPSSYRVPQFNSGAWQNANFYNNPLSTYHKGPLNIPTPAAPTHSALKSFYSNNNNYNIQQPYQISNNLPNATLSINQPKQNNAHQQQVHVMQNFSTAPVPTPERLTAASAAAKSNQFQSIGSAKVAPSIALIPDLGFVAPAIPTHTSFINSLPKPSINTKK